MISILKDLGETKSLIISQVLNSADIIDLISDSRCSVDESEELVYKQIFPYLYVDETQTETLTYLGIETDMFSRSATIKELKVTVMVYCHKSIMEYKKTGFLGTRVDILSDMVEQVIRNCSELGIGPVHLESVRSVFPHNKYYGRQMTFSVPDFKFKS